MFLSHHLGAAALLRAGGVSAADVPSIIVNGGTKDVITDPGSDGSPNLLLYIQ